MGDLYGEIWDVFTDQLNREFPDLIEDTDENIDKLDRVLMRVINTISLGLRP